MLSMDNENAMASFVNSPSNQQATHRHSMGNSNITQRQIHAQDRFVGTMNRRFVRDRTITLELMDQFMSAPRKNEFAIRDANSGQVVFKAAPISEADIADPTKRRQLLDAYGVPIVGMAKTDQPPISAEYSVVPGGPSSTDVFCSIVTHWQFFDAPLRVNFIDPSSGDPVLISILGRWASRDVVITITKGQNQPTYGLARIHCPGNVLDGVYYMDVAPGVDMALMVLIAAAMDEQMKKHETDLDRKLMASAAKKYEKQVKKNAKKEKKVVAASA